LGGARDGRETSGNGRANPSGASPLEVRKRSLLCCTPRLLATIFWSPRPAGSARLDDRRGGRLGPAPRVVQRGPCERSVFGVPDASSPVGARPFGDVAEAGLPRGRNSVEGDSRGATRRSFASCSAACSPGLDHSPVGRGPAAARWRGCSNCVGSPSVSDADPTRFARGRPRALGLSSGVAVVAWRSSESRAERSKRASNGP
jgi:hypothetical protein